MRLLLGWLLLPLAWILALLRFALLLPFPRRVPPYATLRLKGSLPWRRLPGGRRRHRRRRGPTVQELEERLAALAREPRLRGVIVRVEDLRASRARREAVAEALGRFRAAGKEVVVYWKQATATDCFLLPVADKVFLAPGGALLLVGTAATLTGLRGLLERIGLTPDFVRVGRHKTAPELFTHREPSDEQRQLVDAMLDFQWERLLREVAARRGGDEGWAREVIDGGPYTSRRAVEAGLVDELLYPDELPRRLASSDGSAWPPERAFPSAEAVLASRKWRMHRPRLRPGPRIAVVQLSGIIKGGQSSHFPWSPAVIGEESAVRWLDALRRDRDIRAVLVAIDSRGGLASASDGIRRALERLSEKKPTVAYVENVAASGGYMIASAARRIVAAPGALVGSIGAFSGRMSTQGLLERLGIHQELRSRGANAGLLTTSRPLEERERETLEQELEQVYADFLEVVAKGRKVPVEAIRPHADGQVFLGSRAPAALVDEVGDFRTALRWLCQEIGAAPREVELVRRGMEKLGLRLGLRHLRDFTDEALAASDPLVD